MHKLFGLHVPAVDAVRWTPTRRDGELRNVFTGLRMREYAPAKPANYVVYILRDVVKPTYWYDSPDSGFAIEYTSEADAFAAAIIEVARGPVSGINAHGEYVRLSDVFTTVYDFASGNVDYTNFDLTQMVRAQALTIIEGWMR